MDSCLISNCLGKDQTASRIYGGLNGILHGTKITMRLPARARLPPGPADRFHTPV